MLWVRFAETGNLYHTGRGIVYHLHGLSDIEGNFVGSHAGFVQGSALTASQPETLTGQFQAGLSAEFAVWATRRVGI